MSTWRKTSTAELIELGALEIGDGYRAKNAEFGDTGIPFLRIGNLGEGRLVLDGADRFPEERLGQVASKVSQPGDCVIATKATIGRLAYLDESAPRVLYSPQVSFWRALDRSVLEPRFIRCWLAGKEFEVQAFQTKSSTSMADYINLRDQRRMRMTIPPLHVQRKIAAVLGAYDELIENNLRRIEILEEMAQAVYREWFVNFRFPGHENVPLVDSPLGPIPEGWEAEPFSKLGDFVNGFAFKPAHLGDTGLPIVKIKELKNGVARDTPRNPGAQIAEKFYIEQGDLLFSWSADLVVQLWPHGPALLNQHLFRVLPKQPDIDVDFLVHALTQRLPDFRARAQGTTMRHIKRSALTEVQTVVPPTGLRSLFGDSVRPIHQLVRNLVLQNANLRATHDLLLPKLVSGDLDVSDLDIDTEWLAS